MHNALARKWLPQNVCRRLWGDREKWGLVVREDDACWREWERALDDFYEGTQRDGVGTFINDAGYKVMRDVDLGGLTVLEIGPGNIRHDRNWPNSPSHYLLADIRASMNDKAESMLTARGTTWESILLERGGGIPLDDSSVDVVVSFYSLEHIFPLRPYLDELHRVLRPGGVFVGAVPAEGGLAWGLGRFLTSRRWIRKNTRIDPDKIICWEHPNFADDIVGQLDEVFERESVRYWPLRWLPLLDLNLIVKFVYRAGS